MIAPSILSSNFSDLKEIFIQWEAEKTLSLIHFDVMDNHFVPNLTFGHQFIQSLRPYTHIPFDVHLMIQNPLDSLSLYVDAGAQYISLHVEALSPDSFQKLEYFSKKVHLGLAIRPETPIESLFPYLSILDFVLVMSVHPGFSGQKFLPETLQKIRSLHLLKVEKYPALQIEVDGGINADNMFSIMQSGANILVMGSGFFNHPHPPKLLDQYSHYLTLLD